ncbi:MAG: iron-containing alcohol dehydrogenase, partial [Clostridiales bacterium]|nr:iron-containing alcohol dehydrogenase [Clostridiales bacterium]
MQNFTYYSPTRIVFGKETEGKVGQEVKRFGGKRVLLHYGSKSAKESGLLGRVEKSLKEAGISYISLGGVEPNPKLGLVKKGIELSLKEDVDFILAVGGGSAIDSAKAIAIGAKNPNFDLWEEFFVKRTEPDDTLPVGTILTLSATGSEMSYSTVIINEDGMSKRGYSTDKIRPRFSILNPELTYTLPRYQIACGCADIMMHTMERYFSLSVGNEMTDYIAMGVLKTIVKYAPVALKTPDDYEAQSEIMWAGSISHNGLTGLGAV